MEQNWKSKVEKSILHFTLITEGVPTINSTAHLVNSFYRIVIKGCTKPPVKLEALRYERNKTEKE